MNISKRKRTLIIALAKTELNKSYIGKSITKELKSIITKMEDSIADTDRNKLAEGSDK